MKKFLILVGILSTKASFAQSDKKILSDIKNTVYFLADDKLEGRRTGTPGEQKAYEYISASFNNNKLKPLGDNGGFIQPFEVNEGLALGDANMLRINEKNFAINTDYYPMPYSKVGSVNIQHLGEGALFMDTRVMIADNSNNPHYDFDQDLYDKIKAVYETQTISAVIIYNSGDSTIFGSFDKKSKREKIPLFILQVSNNAASVIKSSVSKANPLHIKVEINEKKRTGHNIIGMIDNGAPLTVVLGAHYDHLGYGEDHNSLYAGSDKQIHNGADDNASGSAALIALSKTLHKSKYRKFNYVFAAFSGEELGLYGSKHLVENPPFEWKNINYMINMDMLGRLNDSTRGLTIGGFGTSPAWGQLIDLNDKTFHIKVDSAGSGPSDHTSFYRKDVPVLFFFTGTHSDYHKPGDDADKINFDGELKIIRYIENIILQTADISKLSFTKTRENSMGKSAFKVTMGIMPDYTFSGNGVKVDGVSDNRPAQKAGIKAGDVIVKLGDYTVGDVQSYMQVLGKFNKGDAVKVKLMRNNEEMVVDIVF